MYLLKRVDLRLKMNPLQDKACQEIKSFEYDPGGIAEHTTLHYKRPNSSFMVENKTLLSVMFKIDLRRMSEKCTAVVKMAFR